MRTSTCALRPPRRSAVAHGATRAKNSREVDVAPHSPSVPRRARSADRFPCRPGGDFRAGDRARRSRATNNGQTHATGAKAQRRRSRAGRCSRRMIAEPVWCGRTSPLPSTGRLNTESPTSTEAARPEWDSTPMRHCGAVTGETTCHDVDDARDRGIAVHRRRASPDDLDGFDRGEGRERLPRRPSRYAPGSPPGRPPSPRHSPLRHRRRNPRTISLRVASQSVEVDDGKAGHASQHVGQGCVRQPARSARGQARDGGRATGSSESLHRSGHDDDCAERRRVLRRTPRLPRWRRPSIRPESHDRNPDGLESPGLLLRWPFRWPAARCSTRRRIRATPRVRSRTYCASSGVAIGPPWQSTMTSGFTRLRGIVHRLHALNRFVERHRRGLHADRAGDGRVHVRHDDVRAGAREAPCRVLVEHVRAGEHA